MNIGLVAIFRSLDGFEVCFGRSVEMPAAPLVGTTVSVGGVFMRVNAVHFNVDDGTYLVGVEPEMTVPVPHPRNRADLLEALRPKLAGWEVVSTPPHLHVAK
jgi:hypothetical protein